MCPVCTFENAVGEQTCSVCASDISVCRVAGFSCACVGYFSTPLCSIVFVSWRTEGLTWHLHSLYLGALYHTCIRAPPVPPSTLIALASCAGVWCRVQSQPHCHALRWIAPT